MQLERSPYYPHCFIPLAYLYINKGEKDNNHFLSSGTGLDFLTICFIVFTDQGDWFEFNNRELGWLKTENVSPCFTQRITKIKMNAFTNGKDNKYFMWHSQVLDSFSF